MSEPLYVWCPSAWPQRLWVRVCAAWTILRGRGSSITLTVYDREREFLAYEVSDRRS